MWVYSIKTGMLTHDGSFEGTGYSGRGAGRNNPNYDHIRNIGPLPRGVYTIGKARDGGKLGPLVMALTPDPSNDMFGRAGFFMHGDNRDGDASHGCIVLGHALRQLIAGSGDSRLTVEA